VLSETPSAVAILGISGAPRLLMSATRTATHTSVGMVARARHDRAMDADGSPSFSVADPASGALDTTSIISSSDDIT
jgi:hypothetical protein